MTTIARTKADWRWMNKSTLVGDHGHRPVILMANRKGQLVQRGPDGLLVEIDPEHPDMKAIAGSGRLLAAVEAFMKLRATIFPEVHGAEECAALKELEAAVKDAGGEVPNEA